MQALNNQHPSFHLAGLRACGAQLAAVGFHAPSWEELAHGVRPEPVVWDADFDPGLPRHDWQRIATIPVHGELVEGSVRPRLSQSEQALFRSQGGPLSSVPFTCFPTSPLTRFDESLFRVLLLLCGIDPGRRRKERTYPELSGAHGRARLVVLACEVGGRWSSVTQAFLRQQGQDSPSSRSSHQRQVGLVVEVELDSGLCQCPRLRTVSV